MSPQKRAELVFCWIASGTDAPYLEFEEFYRRFTEESKPIHGDAKAPPCTGETGEVSVN